MIKKIIFYNHYHNGDIFISKEYIKQLVDSFPEIEFEYHHHNGSKILKDLNISYVKIQNENFPQHEQFVYDSKNKFLYINTWIGAKFNHSFYGCTFVSYSYMWENIFLWLSLFLPKDRLILKDKYFYIPKINYEKYDVPINLDIDYENTILFSNGDVHSGQASWQNTDNVVNALLNNFKDKKIILTKKTNIQHPNILYTDDLIQTEGSDLNEISWIAEKCKHLIGRHSGPFIFMNTENILNDETKNIIAFGTSETDGLPYAMNIKSNYIFFNDANEENLIKNIVSHIKNGVKQNKIIYKSLGIPAHHVSINAPEGVSYHVKIHGRDTQFFSKSLFSDISPKHMEQFILYNDDAILIPRTYRQNHFALLTESKDFVPHIYVAFQNNISTIHNNFNLIFTHDKSLLNLSPKMRWVPANGAWVTDYKINNKTKRISMFCSFKAITFGHKQRLNYAIKLYQENADVDIYGYGIPFGLGHIEPKEKGLNDYMYSIAMENAGYSGYFTEKILDCFLTGTIPIYYGDPDIGDVFNLDGIIPWSEDLDLNSLTEELYYSKMDAIKENFEIAKKFLCLEDYIYENYLKDMKL